MKAGEMLSSALNDTQRIVKVFGIGIDYINILVSYLLSLYLCIDASLSKISCRYRNTFINLCM